MCQQLAGWAWCHAPFVSKALIVLPEHRVQEQALYPQEDKQGRTQPYFSEPSSAARHEHTVVSESRAQLAAPQSRVLANTTL